MAGAAHPSPDLPAQQSDLLCQHLHIGKACTHEALQSDIRHEIISEREACAMARVSAFI